MLPQCGSVFRSGALRSMFEKKEIKMFMNLRVSRWLGVTGAAFVLLVSALAAHAEDRRERGAILLGSFITDRDTETRLDSDAGDGTDLDLEDDLGFETSTNVLRVGGYYWFGKRSRVDVAYFDLSRDASKRTAARGAVRCRRAAASSSR